MLKRPIKFKDFNDQEVTEIHYFNLSKTELVEMEVEHQEGFQARMQKIIASSDRKLLIKEFKEIVLLCYGEKSEDGKRFVKSDEIREAFSHTAAYDQLFIELATDDKAAADFILGVVPKDLADEALKAGLLTPKTTAEIAAEQAPPEA